MKPSSISLVVILPDLSGSKRSTPANILTKSATNTTWAGQTGSACSHASCMLAHDNATND